MNGRRISIVAATLVLALAASAAAGPRDDVLEAMGRCTAIPDATARLACYDAAAPKLKEALAQPPAALDHEPTKEEQESWFGFDIGDLFGGGSGQPTTPQQFGKERTAEAQATRQVEEIDSISAGLTEVSFTPFGQFIIFLDNGQVWRQIPGDADKAHFKKNPKDNRVTISHGSLGSYDMTINDSNSLFKVTRIK